MLCSDTEIETVVHIFLKHPIITGELCLPGWIPTSSCVLPYK